MARYRVMQVFSIAATVVAALALVRLADAFGKRELMRVAREVDADRAAVETEYRDLLTRREGLEQDQQLLTQRIAFMSKREHYIVIVRRRRRLKLVLGDMEMLEVRYRLRGSIDGIDGFRSLPKAELEVLGKRLRTDWYKPDWLYELEGVEPPVDSSGRRVRDVFGPGELFLGGAISIHGRRRGGMPSEAVDHTYIELDDKSLRAVMNAIEPGARVFIE